MELCWCGILHSTNKSMGDDYSEIYEIELSEGNEVHEEYGNIIIQINERNSSRKGGMKLPEVKLNAYISLCNLLEYIFSGSPWRISTADILIFYEF